MGHNLTLLEWMKIWMYLQYKNQYSDKRVTTEERTGLNDYQVCITEVWKSEIENYEIFSKQYRYRWKCLLHIFTEVLYGRNGTKGLFLRPMRITSKLQFRDEIAWPPRSKMNSTHPHLTWNAWRVSGKAQHDIGTTIITPSSKFTLKFNINGRKYFSNFSLRKTI